MKTFEVVWQKVNDSFFDPKFNGVDWRAVKKKYGAKVALAHSSADFYKALNEMLGELKESHFAVIPRTAYLPEEERGRGAREADAGMTVQLVEGKPTIVRVDPGRPAAKAGLKPGFIVVKVGGDLVADIQRKLATRKERAIMKDFLLSAVVHSKLAGKVGTRVKVQVLDGEDKPRSVELRLERSVGKPIKFLELPVIYGYVDSKRLPEGVGLLRFNIFLMDLLDPIETALQSFDDEKAVIIDLRGNPGGFAGMALPICRHFLNKETSLGTMRTRTNAMNLVVENPDRQPFSGPLAILTDEGSASTSEILAAGLQECGRAVVVGSRTLGAALPSALMKLPDGSRLQYAIADFRTAKGLLLEGRGVNPDVVVLVTRKDLLAGKDPVLDRAVAVLLQKAAK